MAFDKDTRNKLARLVADCRRLLTDEFLRQCQSIYGIQPDGSIASLESLARLDDRELSVARQLRERIAYLASNETAKNPVPLAIERMVREQAFTVMNRLAAMRMAEARGLIVESVSKGMDSQGFEMYDQIVGPAMGEKYQRYCSFLFSMFDEIAIDLGSLFERYSPYGLLFPQETALLELLKLINQNELSAIWAEDETIGWIYQYYNDPEERKKMRKESAAPRNSRELAVRNQFFTPRYVVEFLTDNTLGRIWYEMTRGQTRLAEQCRYLVRRPTEIFLAEGEATPETPDQEGLSRDELLKQPVHIPHRPLKDPREIRLLDPACGSMHFGLYAFDLFETIYEEAWDNGSCPALQEAYASRDEFLQDVPRLIIEHNIHGIDIDPRAVQIAGLSLWLRAQKAWQARGVKPAIRPRVRRSNIVCAEPMPGSPEMLESFIANLDPSRLGDLVRTVFDKMHLAGEAGSLLKIEEEIRTAIDTARKEWLKQQDDLLTRKDGSHEEFFDTAEQQVIDALRAYAEQADADSYQRRLFADDAARGFAFIDLCRKRYDAVVMNPPFGDSAEDAFNYLASKFPDWKKNILCCFFDRAVEIADSRGLVGAIFDRTVAVKSSYEDFRKKTFLSNSRISNFSDLGWEVLDANVEVASAVLDGSSLGPSLFFDLRSYAPDEKGIRLISCIEGEEENNTWSVIPDDFRTLPNAVVGYDFSQSLLRLFSHYPSLECSGFKAYTGSQLPKEPHFRLWWEQSLIDKAPIALSIFKGGRQQAYVSSMRDYFLSRKYFDELPIGSSTKIYNLSQYGKPGVCWGERGDWLCVYALPKKTVFALEGPTITTNERSDSLRLLACLNSVVARNAINKICGQHKTSGYVNLLPFLRDIDQEVIDDLDSVIKQLIRARSADETQLLFTPPTSDLIFIEKPSPIAVLIEESLAESLRIQRRIDESIFVKLSLDRDEISELASLKARVTKDEYPVEDYDAGDQGEQFLIPSAVSWVLGYCLGRWDIRYATGERQPPELPDPFDPLPVCPPGMLQNAEGLPAEPKDVPAAYPLRISWPGILVDDENHPEDIVARVREAIEVIWKDRAEAIEQEACGILGVKTLRDYFRRPAAFFADHLKRYSKSRRQAPIYWPLSTKSGSYTLWLYYHRLTDQTLSACVNDFIEPKIEQCERELNSLNQKLQAGTADKKTNDEIARLGDLIGELKDLQAELLRVDKLPYKPNLNDGVIITAAPLWQCFGLPAWNKKLKETWQKLEKEEYDWAHLSYSIWPDRVKEKCKHDKSLAIAHGLESVYIEPPAKPKKKAAEKKAKQS